MAYCHRGLCNPACDEGAATCPFDAREPLHRLGGTTGAGIRVAHNLGHPARHRSAPQGAARHSAAWTRHAS
jgi:hypothetical protein